MNIGFVAFDIYFTTTVSQECLILNFKRGSLKLKTRLKLKFFHITYFLYHSIILFLIPAPFLAQSHEKHLGTFQDLLSLALGRQKLGQKFGELPRSSLISGTRLPIRINKGPFQFLGRQQL